MTAMSFLQKHPKTGVYRVRIRIPGRAQAAFGGKREFLKSLGTKDLAEAKRLAFPIVAEVQAKIARAMAGQIHWEAHSIAEAERDFWWWIGDINCVGTDATFPSRNNFLGNLARYVEAKLPNLSAPDHDELRRFIEAEAEPLPRPLYPSAARPPVSTTPKAVKLSQLEAKQLAQNSYRPRVVEDVRKSYAYLRELNGDCEISKIGPDQIREWRNLLLAYPVKGRTKGLKLRDAAKQTWERTTNPKTVAKLLGFIRKGFRLAVSEGWINENPTRDISIVKTTPGSKDAPRVEFSPDQLTKLFTSPLFVGCRSEHRVSEPGNVAIRDHRYWMPWLALYTGGRISELCALETTDLRKDGEVWYLHLSEQADDESLAGQKHKKTKFSTRDVPLHRDLIARGFVEWVQEQPRGLMFRTNYKNIDAFAQIYSTKFRTYLKDIGVSGVSMHSFRHGFATATRMAGVPDEIHNALAGRSQRGVGQQYGEQKRLMVRLAEAINSLTFEGVPPPA